MQIAVIPLSKRQQALASCLKDGLDSAKLLMPAGNGGLKGVIKEAFFSYKQLVLIMPVGVAVRLTAPYLKSKHTDPGIVVVDTAGRFAVSLCGGHEGGANWLSYAVAQLLNAVPVITTGSEVRKSLLVGVGCRRGEKPEVIYQAVHSLCQEAGFSLTEVKALATVDIKRTEAGLKEAAKKLSLPLIYQPLTKLRLVKLKTPAKAAQKHLQVDGVCEAAALLTAHQGRLVWPKTNINGVSLAVVKDEAGWQAS